MKGVTLYGLEPLALTAAVNWAPDVEAFMGGVGVGLSVLFVTFLLTLGIGVIRRFLG